jgi:hypothetical protein
MSLPIGASEWIFTAGAMKCHLFIFLEGSFKLNYSTIARGLGYRNFSTVQRRVDLALGPPPGAATHWTGRMLAKTAGVSLRSVQRILEIPTGAASVAHLQTVERSEVCHRTEEECA